ncbi:MAG: hypothetical protein JRC86_05950 [Deltaproteobacteria bacterium]|nr:hypothetical protein [Deltaproteobacteria bacterium]
MKVNRKIRYHLWPRTPIAAAPPSLPQMREFAHAMGVKLLYERGLSELGYYFFTRRADVAKSFATALRLTHGVQCEVKKKRWRKRRK